MKMAGRGCVRDGSGSGELSVAPRARPWLRRDAPQRRLPQLPHRWIRSWSEFAKLHAHQNTAAATSSSPRSAGTHDDEGKQTLREEFNKHITEILTSHGTTQAD
jgi:hypothetical protein